MAFDFWGPVTPLIGGTLQGAAKRIYICAVAAAMLAACTSNDNADNMMNADENLTTSEVPAVENASVPSTALVFCPVVERRISKDDCDDLARVESDVKLGAAAFNVPNPLVRDQTQSITLVVDRRPPEEIAAIENLLDTAEEANASDNAEANASSAEMNAVESNELAEAPRTRARRRQPIPSETARMTPRQVVEQLGGTAETLIPKVGRRMSADLSGGGFAIKALMPRTQEIPPGESATWEWSVTPKQAGARVLTLKTVVEGEVGGKQYALARTETVKSVRVKVSPAGRVADAFDSSIAWLNRMKLVLLAIAGALGAAWAVRRAWKGSGAKDG